MMPKEIRVSGLQFVNELLNRINGGTRGHTGHRSSSFELRRFSLELEVLSSPRSWHALSSRLYFAENRARFVVHARNGGVNTRVDAPRDHL